MFGTASRRAAAAPASEGTTNLPLITIRQFLATAPSLGETSRVRLQGTVTHTISDRTYFIQDDNVGLYVFHKPRTAFRVGEWVEVTGYASLGAYAPTIQRCQARSLGMRPPPEPRVVTFAEAMSGRAHMLLVRMSGRLAEERLRAGKHLVLNAGGGSNSFVAELESIPDLSPFARLEAGSLLEVTGVCSVRSGPDRSLQGFKVFVRSPADVVVVRGAPWWTHRRTVTTLGITTGALLLVVAWVAYLRRKVHRQQADLWASEEFRQTVIEAEPECVKVVSADGRLVEINPTGLRLVEAESMAQVAGLPMIELVTPEHREAFQALHERVVKGGNGSLQFEAIGLKGTRRWFETHSAPLRDERRRVTSVVSITRDVTERRRVDQERACLIDIVESTTDLVASADAQGHLQYLNRAGRRLLCVPESEDITVLGVADFHSPAVTERLLNEIFPEVIRAGYWEGETLFRARDGQELQLSQVIIAHRTADGRVDRLSTIARDVSDRRRAEEALRESRERLDGILASLDDVVWSASPDGSRLLFVNSAVEGVLGRPAAEFFDRPDLWFAVIHPQDQPRVAQAMKELRNHDRMAMEYRIVRPDGAERWVRDRVRLVKDASGQPQRIDGIASDITVQREAAERIRNLNAELEQRVKARTSELQVANEELESFGYSVSHDLRAPLRAIEGFSRILGKEHASQLDAAGQRCLARVCAATERMGALIDGLLKLSRINRAPVKREAVDVSLMAHGILADLRAAEPERRVEARVASGLRAEADAVLLRAVLENLIGNAWKYSRRRPVAHLAVGAQDRDGERVFFVRDDGAGFDMTYADKLFAPFQRLHSAEDFDGTGIGLATVHRITHRHGGRVWADATVDEGATFYFTLAPCNGGSRLAP